MKCRKIIILLLTLTMALSLFSGAAFGSEPEENASEEAAEEIIEESALEEEASQESEEEEAFEEPAEEALTMTALEEVNAPVLTAAGEEVSGLTIGNVNIKDQTYYLVNGETLEETTSNEGYAVYYNSNTSTLTLNGLSLPTAALTVPAGTTIVVSGTSNELASIVAAGALTIQIDSALTVSGKITASGNLTIGGSGTLTASSGIDATGFNLVIGDSVKVNIGETTNYGLTAQNITIQDSAVVSDAGTGSKEAIYANGGNLTIQDSATVKTESRGINATYQVSISGNANVTVTNESGNGINAGTGITVLGKAIVTATGKYGLNCRNGDVVLEGTVTATATNSNA